MIANGGMIKCGGRDENVKLQLKYYYIIRLIFSIYVGGCDIVLWVDLCTSGPVTMDFNEMYIWDLLKRFIDTPSKGFGQNTLKSSTLTIYWKVIK